MQKLLSLLALTFLTAAVGFGQKTDPNAVDETNTREQRKVSSKNKKSDDNSILKTNTALEAELQKTLDVKNARIGDEVVLKVTKTIKQDGEVIVPKGAKILGRVTEVQERTNNNAMSKLGVVFERIEGKNLNSPINATISSITNVASSASLNNDLLSSDSSANSSSTGSVSSSGSSGGGVLGGVTNTVGGVVNTTTNTVGSATNTAGQTLGGATGTVGNTVRGLNISQSASGSANGSTTLSTQNKNLKVEKGATFKLFVSESVEN
ncbi:hypothetical protein BH20ACI4_BH20ACI4_23760 [soil metagenome]